MIEVGMRPPVHREVGKKGINRRLLKSEVGPVVVPGGRDYAAASMRKSEKRNRGRGLE